MIKIGVAGARGLWLLGGLQSVPDVEIVALCDLNEELLKEQSAQFNIPKTYRVYEDMLESDIDAVIVSTPMQCHVPQVIAALQAGKHVMSEVTAGVTMDELWWLIETVEKSGKIYMFSENYCYSPENQLVRVLSQKGFWGDVGKIAISTPENPNGFKEWHSLTDFNEYLPQRYRLATDEQKQASHGGGDFFVGLDFLDAINNCTIPAIDVYKACEWTAVGLLSELSVTNANRTIEMPNFRKNMPYEEKIIKL